MKAEFLMVVALLMAALLMFGCASNAPSQSAPSGVAPAAPSSDSSKNSEVNSVTTTQAANGNPVVVFETTKGKFSAEIFVKEAPITGNNFMKLVNSKFYDGLKFHRVIPGFMAQGGDPKGDGTGGANTTIPLEIKPNLKHKLGTLAMARSNAPNSASSQFYIVNGEASFLDGNYAVFGQVLGDGMGVVLKFNTGEPPANPDRMLKVYEQK